MRLNSPNQSVYQSRKGKEVSEEESVTGEEVDTSEMDIVDVLRLFAEIAEKLEGTGNHFVVMSPLMNEAADEIDYLRSRAVEDITVVGADEEIIVQITGDDIPRVLHEAVQMWVDAFLREAAERGEIEEASEE